MSGADLNTLFVKNNMSLMGLGKNDLLKNFLQSTIELVDNGIDACKLHQSIYSDCVDYHIEITISKTTLPILSTYLHNENKLKNCVLIQVIDNGIGIENVLSCLTCFKSCVPKSTKQTPRIGKFGCGLSAVALASWMMTRQAIQIASLQKIDDITKWSFAEVVYNAASRPFVHRTYNTNDTRLNQWASDYLRGTLVRVAIPIDDDELIRGIEDDFIKSIIQLLNIILSYP